MKLIKRIAGLLAAATLACATLLGPALSAAAADLDAADRRAAILKAADLIEERYVYPDKGAAIAAALRADADRFDETNAEAFAEALTGRLRDLSSDGHFAVEVSAEAETDAEAETETETETGALERWYGAHVNHGFEAVRRLDGGIGYLDLRVFAPVEMGGDLAAASMSLLAQSPALIIDLRHNGGGMGEMALMLSAYLHDRSVEMSGVYDRPSDTLTRAFTPSWVPGRRFGGDKPVFVLISSRTFSAAEHFAYDLQAMDRAVIVGERSDGGAHPFEYRPLGNGFTLSLPEGRSVSPITGGDWEGTGVIPDVKAPETRALDVALRLAKEALAKRAAQ